MALTETEGTAARHPAGGNRAGPGAGCSPQALLDPDPVYSGDGAPVPPTFPFVMPYWGSLGEGGAAGPPHREPAGQGAAPSSTASRSSSTTAATGRMWATTLVGDGQISDVYEKEKSSGGKLEFLTSPRPTWKNERTGKPVVTTKFTLRDQLQGRRGRAQAAVLARGLLAAGPRRPRRDP